ncbi:NUDIX hydrolase [Streptomyces sp. NPDC054796]
MSTAVHRQRHHRICDVHLLLIRDDHVLLSRRRGGYAAGLWHVPSGHLEPGEHTAAGAAREGEEELGIQAESGELELVHFIDHRAPGEDPRLGFFYRARSWSGEPQIREPDKCDGLDWFPLSRPPQACVPYHTTALFHIAHGHTHSTYGWQNAPGHTETTLPVA